MHILFPACPGLYFAPEMDTAVPNRSKRLQSDTTRTPHATVRPRTALSPPPSSLAALPPSAAALSSAAPAPAPASADAPEVAFAFASPPQLAQIARVDDCEGGGLYTAVTAVTTATTTAATAPVASTSAQDGRFVSIDVSAAPVVSTGNLVNTPGKSSSSAALNANNAHSTVASASGVTPSGTGISAHQEYALRSFPPMISTATAATSRDSGAHSGYIYRRQPVISFPLSPLPLSTAVAATAAVAVATATGAGAVASLPVPPVCSSVVSAFSQAFLSSVGAFHPYLDTPLGTLSSSHLEEQLTHQLSTPSHIAQQQQQQQQHNNSQAPVNATSGSAAHSPSGSRSLLSYPLAPLSLASLVSARAQSGDGFTLNEMAVLARTVMTSLETLHSAQTAHGAVSLHTLRFTQQNNNNSNTNSYSATTSASDNAQTQSQASLSPLSLHMMRLVSAPHALSLWVAARGPAFSVSSLLTAPDALARASAAAAAAAAATTSLTHQSNHYNNGTAIASASADASQSGVVACQRADLYAAGGVLMQLLLLLDVASAVDVDAIAPLPPMVAQIAATAAATAAAAASAAASASAAAATANNSSSSVVAATAATGSGRGRGKTNKASAAIASAVSSPEVLLTSGGGNSGGGASSSGDDSKVAVNVVCECVYCKSNVTAKLNSIGANVANVKYGVNGNACASASAGAGAGAGLLATDPVTWLGAYLSTYINNNISNSSGGDNNGTIAKNAALALTCSQMPFNLANTSARDLNAHTSSVVSTIAAIWPYITAVQQRNGSLLTLFTEQVLASADSVLARAAPAPVPTVTLTPVAQKGKDAAKLIAEAEAACLPHDAQSRYRHCVALTSALLTTLQNNNVGRDNARCESVVGAAVRAIPAFSAYLPSVSAPTDSASQTASASASASASMADGGVSGGLGVSGGVSAGASSSLRLHAALLRGLILSLLSPAPWQRPSAAAAAALCRALAPAPALLLTGVPLEAFTHVAGAYTSTYTDASGAHTADALFKQTLAMGGNASTGSLSTPQLGLSSSRGQAMTDDNDGDSSNNNSSSTSNTTGAADESGVLSCDNSDSEMSALKLFLGSALFAIVTAAAATAATAMAVPVSAMRPNFVRLLTVNNNSSQSQSQWSGAVPLTRASARAAQSQAAPSVSLIIECLPLSHTLSNLNNNSSSSSGSNSSGGNAVALKLETGASSASTGVLSDDERAEVEKRVLRGGVDCGSIAAQLSPAAAEKVGRVAVATLAPPAVLPALFALLPASTTDAGASGPSSTVNNEGCDSILSRYYDACTMNRSHTPAESSLSTPLVEDGSVRHALLSAYTATISVLPSNMNNNNTTNANALTHSGVGAGAAILTDASVASGSVSASGPNESAPVAVTAAATTARLLASLPPDDDIAAPTVTATVPGLLARASAVDSVSSALTVTLASLPPFTRALMERYTALQRRFLAHSSEAGDAADHSAEAPPLTAGEESELVSLHTAHTVTVTLKQRAAELTHARNCLDALIAAADASAITDLTHTNNNNSSNSNNSSGSSSSSGDSDAAVAAAAAAGIDLKAVRRAVSCFLNSANSNGNNDNNNSSRSLSTVTASASASASACGSSICVHRNTSSGGASEAYDSDAHNECGFDSATPLLLLAAQANAATADSLAAAVTALQTVASAVVAGTLASSNSNSSSSSSSAAAVGTLHMSDGHSAPAVLAAGGASGGSGAAAPLSPRALTQLQHQQLQQQQQQTQQAQVRSLRPLSPLDQRRALSPSSQGVLRATEQLGELSLALAAQQEQRQIDQQLQQQQRNGGGALVKTEGKPLLGEEVKPELHAPAASGRRARSPPSGIPRHATVSPPLPASVAANAAGAAAASAGGATTNSALLAALAQQQQLQQQQQQQLLLLQQQLALQQQQQQQQQPTLLSTPVTGISAPSPAAAAIDPLTGAGAPALVPGDSADDNAALRHLLGHYLRVAQEKSERACCSFCGVGWAILKRRRERRFTALVARGVLPPTVLQSVKRDAAATGGMWNGTTVGAGGAGGGKSPRSLSPKSSSPRSQSPSTNSTANASASATAAATLATATTSASGAAIAPGAVAAGAGAVSPPAAAAASVSQTALSPSPSDPAHPAATEASAAASTAATAAAAAATAAAAGGVGGPVAGRGQGRSSRGGRLAATAAAVAAAAVPRGRLAAGAAAATATAAAATGATAAASKRRGGAAAAGGSKGYEMIDDDGDGGDGGGGGVGAGGEDDNDNDDEDEVRRDCLAKSYLFPERLWCTNLWCNGVNHSHRAICGDCLAVQSEYFGPYFPNVFGDITAKQWYCLHCMVWADLHPPQAGMCCCTFRRGAEVDCLLHTSPIGADGRVRTLTKTKLSLSHSASQLQISHKKHFHNDIFPSLLFVFIL